MFIRRPIFPGYQRADPSLNKRIILSDTDSDGLSVRNTSLYSCCSRSHTGKQDFRLEGALLSLVRKWTTLVVLCICHARFSSISQRAVTQTAPTVTPHTRRDVYQPGQNRPSGPIGCTHRLSRKYLTTVAACALIYIASEMDRTEGYVRVHTYSKTRSSQRIPTMCLIGCSRVVVFAAVQQQGDGEQWLTYNGTGEGVVVLVARGGGDSALIGLHCLRLGGY